MTAYCDFCSRPIASGEGERVELRVTATSLTVGKGALSFHFVRLACEASCARNHCDGIDAGALTSRRALESRLSQDLSDANDRVRHLESELAIAKRGAVRYAARMVEHAAIICQQLPVKLEALTGIENFAKRLSALPAPPSRYEREWSEARLEAMMREARQ